MTPPEFLTEPMWQKLSLVLLHFLWQGLAVAVLAAIVARLDFHRRPGFRHACYLAGLLAMVGCPLVTFALIELPGDRLHITSASLVLPPPVEESRWTTQPGETAGDTIHHATISFSPIADQPSQTPTAARTLDALGVIRSLGPYMLMAWLAGVGILGGRMLLGFVVIWRLRRSQLTVSAELLAAARRMSQRIGLKNPPRMAASRRVAEAVATGFFRPLILLPASWLIELPPDVLEAVIAHELAHVRRRDLWINLLARVVETLLFYHPAVWWLTGRLRIERELCCDELAVAATGRRVVYARALEFVARRKMTGGRPILATGLGGKRMVLLDRVRHVLGMTDGERKLGWWSAGIIALAIPLLLWGVSSTFRPALADDEDPDRERVAAEGDEDGGERGERRRESAEREDRERGERARGEREREGRPRTDRDRREGERREGERRERERRESEERRGGREREGERELSRAQLLEIITQLRREMAEMRRALAVRRGDRLFPPRESDRPRPDGDRPRVDRPFEGRPPIGRRDGDRPPGFRRDSEGVRKDPLDPFGEHRGPRDPAGGRKGPRDRDVGPKFRREGDRPRPDGPGPGGRGTRGTLPPEIIKLLHDLQGQVERLRNDVNELRGRRPGGREGRPDQDRPDGQRLDRERFGRQRTEADPDDVEDVKSDRPAAEPELGEESTEPEAEKE